MYEQLFKRIIDASRNDSLTFFVGAGVSKLSNAPKWSELIDLFCKQMKRPTKVAYSNDEYLSVPQMFYYSIGKNEDIYYDFIDNCFGDTKLETNIIHKMLFDFNPKSFITTNFDDLLEDAAVENCQSFKSVAQDEDIADINGDKFILKLHGDLKHRNIVLKEEDYLNYSEAFKLTETLLKSMFATDTVVFIGYGLNDYNIKLVLNWTKSLLKDKFNKPIFIYTDSEELTEEELKYHESKGLSVVDYKNLCDSSKLDEKDYFGRYKCVLDAINGVSEYSVDNKNEFEAFDVLYTLVKPLAKFNTLRIQDVRKKLSKFIIIEDNGVINLYAKSSIIIRYFQKINDMDLAERKKLPEITLEKYETILTVFSKARITGIIDSENKPVEIIGSNYAFANDNCILFDYNAMLEYVNREYSDDYSNYVKAYYLAKLQKHNESYDLFTTVAINSFKKKNYLLHFLAQANRNTVYTAMKSINNHMLYYNEYDLQNVKGGALTLEKMQQVFENLPAEFQKQYSGFKDLISANLLYENAYYAFIDGEKLKNTIESNTIEWGQTKGDKVICRINNNLHFFLGNYLYVEEFSEFKNTIKNLMSLLIYKYSVQNKKNLETIGFGNSTQNDIMFDEVDFFCIIEYFTDKEISEMLKKHNINTIEFRNIESIDAAVSNLLDYYSKQLFNSKRFIEKVFFENKIKKCLTLLRHIDVSQDLIDRICLFIFKYEFRKITIDDKILFIDSQIYRRKKYSNKTSEVIENKLLSYIDNHMKAIEKKEKFNLHSSHSGINYYNLVRYISQDDVLLHPRRLSLRVSKIINNSYSNMKQTVTQFYYEYLSEYQKRKVVNWIKKEIKKSFDFDDFFFLITHEVDIDKSTLNLLKTSLKKQCEQSKVDSPIIVFPRHNHLKNLEEVGYLCFTGYLDKKMFKAFVGQSNQFDFFYYYERFDFAQFNISWLLSFTSTALEKIASNCDVKEKIRRLGLSEIKEGKLNEESRKKLTEVLANFFN